MKKLLFVLCTLFCLNAFSCGGSSAPSTGTTDTTTSDKENGEIDV